MAELPEQIYVDEWRSPNGKSNRKWYREPYPDTIEYIRADIHQAELDKRGEWLIGASDALMNSMKPRPIDTAPKDGIKIICIWADSSGNNIVGLEGGYHTSGGWNNLHHEPFFYSPSHWLPLPPEVKP